MQDPLKQIHLYVKYFLVTNYNSWISVGFIHAGSFFTNKQASKWWKIAGKLLFPLQKIFIVEDYVCLVNKKSKDIELHKRKRGMAK